MHANSRGNDSACSCCVCCAEVGLLIRRHQSLPKNIRALSYTEVSELLRWFCLDLFSLHPGLRKAEKNTGGLKTSRLRRTILHATYINHNAFRLNSLTMTQACGRISYNHIRLVRGSFILTSAIFMLQYTATV